MADDDFIVCSRWGTQRVKSVKRQCTDCGIDVAVSAHVAGKLPAHVKPLCMNCAMPGLEGQAEVLLAPGALEEVAAYSAYRRMQGR